MAKNKVAPFFRTRCIHHTTFLVNGSIQAIDHWPVTRMTHMSLVTHHDRLVHHRLWSSK